LNFEAHIGRKEQEVDPAFWAARYAAGDTGWDKGEASPGLVDYLVENEALVPGTGLVPGCGHGHDARALAAAGFEVTAIDVVPAAIEKARSLARAERVRVRFEAADFFSLPAALQGPYDWLFEHTFFCAIDPARRDEYVRIAAERIRPGGHLLGVFYNIQPETGPPFGTTRAELLARFAPAFTLEHESVPRSYENRTGKELLMLWRRN
jgi:SAM-dependent methyltransferase